MKTEKTENTDLDVIFREALEADDKFIIPDGLAEKTIRKLEKKILLRELIFELLIKVIIITGSLAILMGVFIMLKGEAILYYLSAISGYNWQRILPILILILITVLIDQVGVRFYNEINEMQTGIDNFRKLRIK